MTIILAKDFSRYPAGRYVGDGPFSGERFRNEFLAPKLDSLTSGQRLQIFLDGARGYGSSFLEEAFGGLMRLRRNLTADAFWQKVELITDDPSLKAEISEYVANARNS